MPLFESGIFDRVESKIRQDILPAVGDAIKHDIVPNIKAAVSDATMHSLRAVKSELYRGLTEGKELKDSLYDAAYSGASAAKDRIVRKIYDNVDLPFLEIEQETIPDKTDKAQDIRLEMKVEGREREYLLHIPPGYDRKKSMPLVVVLHGVNESDKDIAELTKMSEKADKEGFIVAYPNSTKWLGTNTWKAWDTKNGISPPLTSSDDVGFVGKVIDSISDKMGVDKNQVYVTGFSNGGMLAHRIASELSDKVAAVAIVGGAMSGYESNPKSPVSVMTINGTADCVIPYTGLESCESMQRIGIPKFQSGDYAFNFWRNANGGTAETDISVKTSDLEVRRSVNPKTNAEVVSYLLVGGKHEWPGSNRALKQPGNPDAKFSATDRIWEFFTQHAKKGGN